MAPPSVPTLYHVQWYNSSILYHIALELSIPSSHLKVIHLTENELRHGSEIAKYSPRRSLPILALPNSAILSDIEPIVMFILENYDQSHKLHPKQTSSKRQNFLDAVLHYFSRCYRAAMDVFLYCHHKPPSRRDHRKLRDLTDNFNRVVINHLLRELKNGKNRYYLGSDFSVADIMYSYLLVSAEFCGIGLLNNRVIQTYFQRIKARPAFRRLYDHE